MTDDLFTVAGVSLPPVKFGRNITKHPLYLIWAGMRQRCENERHASFKNYGARGIGVCREWRVSSLAFVRWALENGWQKGLELDREDNEGPYSPVNCRFVTRKVQGGNRRNNYRTEDGRLALDVALANGVKKSAFYGRLQSGKSPDEAAMPTARAAARPLVMPDGRSVRSECERIGFPYETVRSRVHRFGWSIQDALAVPPYGKKPE